MRILLTFIVAGTLTAAGASARADEVAHAGDPDKTYIVFMDEETAPHSAAGILVGVKKDENGQITLEGRADQVSSVRNELVREGVPSDVIMLEVVDREPGEILENTMEN